MTESQADKLNINKLINMFTNIPAMNEPTNKPDTNKPDTNKSDAHKPPVISIEQHTQTIYHQSFKDPWAPLMMLPAPVQSFVGREEDLEWLTRQLTTVQPAGTGTTIAICGQSGIGKTALVVEAVTRLSSQETFSKRFPDGIFYYSFNAYLEPAMAYEELARIFDRFDQERDLNPRLAAIHSLKRRRALLVFDGLEALAEDQLPPLCNLGGANVVLLISRRQKDVVHASFRRNIVGLSQEDGVALLQKLAGEQATTQSDVAQIVSYMKSIPLVLQLVGSHLAHYQEKATDYLQWFEHAGRTASKKGTQQAIGIMMLLQHTYDTLGPCEQQIFALLGLLTPMPFPKELIQSIITVSPETLQQALDVLVKVSVLRPSAQNYEVSHQIVHTFSKETLPEQINELPAALIFPAPSWIKNVTRVGTPRRKTTQIHAAWKEQLLSTLQTHFARCERLDSTVATLWLPHVLPLLETEYPTSPQTLIVATVLNNAGFNARIQEKYTLAQRLLQTALTIREQQLGADHVDTAQSCNDLAELYIKLLKYSEAEPLFKRALAIREQEIELIYPDTALTLNNLGYLYQIQEKDVEAEPLFKRALAVCKQLAGPVHADTANVINNLALLYNKHNKYSEAEPMFQFSLAIREQQLGRFHPTTAQSMHSLGTLYLTHGKDIEAEHLFQRSLAIREKKLGAEHPDTVISLNTLAIFYRSQEKYSEAEPLFERALKSQQNLLGASHPDMIRHLNDLATLYYEQQKYTLAEPLFQRALDICKRQVKPIHPDMVRILNYLAVLYQDQGKYDLAEPLFQRALIICKQQVGPNHPDMAHNFNNLAVLYKDQRKYAEAESLFQRALTIREEQLGHDHADTIHSLNNLAALYRTRQKYAEAEPLFQRVLTIREEKLGASHPDTAISLNNLAALYKTQEKYTLAQPLFQRALAILEPHLGRSHPTTITVKKNLAALSHLLKEEKSSPEKQS